MGFTLVPSAKFSETVTVLVSQESGAKKEESFTAIFERAPESEREELVQLKNTELVRRKLVGWKMKDEHKNEVPFTEENLEAFLQLTGAVRETAIAFWKGNTGAREKN